MIRRYEIKTRRKYDILSTWLKKFDLHEKGVHNKSARGSVATVLYFNNLR